MVGLSRSSYYAATQARSAAVRAPDSSEEEALLARIRSITAAHPFWGYRRVWAWLRHREGLPGFPIVDDCMRQLRATGWLNYRMRAMLVRFAAYHLRLHWRLPGQFRARKFLDFEAGLHWSQIQIQSGMTGINTLRIYSPAKLGREHDPQGHYVRRWVPEFGTRAYPKPIVDERAALEYAKGRLFRLRCSAEARRSRARFRAARLAQKPSAALGCEGARSRSQRDRQGKLF
jgi:deoxyribodipyrimidine photo-lyase